MIRPSACANVVQRPKGDALMSDETTWLLAFQRGVWALFDAPMGEMAMSIFGMA